MAPTFRCDFPCRRRPPHGTRRRAAPRHRILGAALAAALAGMLLPAGHVHAQPGVRGGLSLSDLVGSGVESADARQGLTGGGGWTLLSLGPVDIGPELFYVQKGTAGLRLDPETGEPVDFEAFGIDYLEVPIMARLAMELPVADGALSAFATGGLAWAWRLQCTLRPAAGGALEVNDGCAIPEFQRFDDVVGAADRGTVLGAGLILQVGEFGSVSLNARGVRGLSRVARDPLDPEARNRAFTLTLGWEMESF